MTKKLISRNILFGFLSWLVPFAASFLFFKPGGQLRVPYGTFKSIIVVVGVITGSYLLFRYFKFVKKDFVKIAVIVGLSWFMINIVLDALVLAPLMKVKFIDYFMMIGLSYFAIPVISITMGYLLNRQIKQQ
jgi:hypothetical protein